jgi:TadE-like protein
MLHRFPMLRRLRRDERGVYIVEFAAITVPLSILLMGSVELGYMAYARSLTEGTLREVSRLATTGSRTEEWLDEYVNTTLGRIPNATIVIEKKSYRDFDDVDEPEPITKDVDGDNYVDDGDCWTDLNENGTHDADSGKTGLGGSEDIIYYGVTVTYPPIIPATANLVNGGSDTWTIASNTVLRNEPYYVKKIYTPVCRDDD